MRTDIRLNTNTHDLVFHKYSKHTPYVIQWQSLENPELFSYGRWKAGMTVLSNGVVSMGGKLFLATRNTKKPPLFTLMDKSHIRLKTKDDNYVITGEQNTADYSIIGTEPILKGVVIVNPDTTQQELSSGLLINIPYTSIHRPIRLQIQDLNGRVLLAWTPVLYKSNSGENPPVFASELIMINSNEQYLVKLNNGQLLIQSGEQYDLEIGNANTQNSNLLLQCVPSNSYRYPISGVGLVRYLHSNVEQTDLSSRVESEFRADNVIVNSASYNSDTGYLDLDLDFLDDGNL